MVEQTYPIVDLTLPFPRWISPASGSPTFRTWDGLQACGSDVPPTAAQPAPRHQ